jgi:hypothetical protein
MTPLALGAGGRGRRQRPRESAAVETLVQMSSISERPMAPQQAARVAGFGECRNPLSTGYEALEGVAPDAPSL